MRHYTLWIIGIMMMGLLVLQSHAVVAADVGRPVPPGTDLQGVLDQGRNLLLQPGKVYSITNALKFKVPNQTITTAGASYLELAEFIMRHGSAPEADLVELWRRIVFNICVSNTDDHLRNHGFILAARDGWTLAPAYDMNPNPQGGGLTLNITENDNRLDLSLVLEVAESFHLDLPRAKELMSAVRLAVRQWRHVATRQGLSKAEQEMMSLSFQCV